VGGSRSDGPIRSVGLALIWKSGVLWTCRATHGSCQGNLLRTARSIISDLDFTGVGSGWHLMRGKPGCDRAGVSWCEARSTGVRLEKGARGHNARDVQRRVPKVAQCGRLVRGDAAPTVASENAPKMARK
jgi:hypothetical protein